MLNHNICILILNWNNWQDTIECLESLQLLDYPSFEVIVVDNASTDGSIEKIKSWAEGKLPIISKFIEYSLDNKPLEVVYNDRKTAEGGGESEKEKKLASLPPNKKLVLIQTGANLGFAGGNNVGIKYALAKDDFDYIWILNNDTVVAPDSLTYMVERMQEDEKIGICGSTLLYYHQPDTIQALGGKYNKWLGLPNHIGEGLKKTDLSFKSQNEVEKDLEYVVGASMLVSKEFIQDIGLMCEDYFLYFEELDWATRAKDKYKLGYAAKSIIYHKEGATIGSSSQPKERSYISDYYGIKNRLLFTKKFYPKKLPFVYIGLIVTVINRIRRRQWDRAKMVVGIVKNSIKYWKLNDKSSIN